MLVLFLDKGILNADGEYWHQARARIRPTFERAHIANLGMFKKHVDRLIANIPRDDSTVDLQPLFKRYILDSSSEFLSGRSVGSQLPERSVENEQFLVAFDCISTNLGKMRQNWFFWRQDKKWAEAAEAVHSFIDARVAEAIEKPGLEEASTDGERFVLSKEMAKLTDDRVQLRHEILHVFLPGHESAGTLLASTFYLLARDTIVWKRLRAEIMAMGQGEPTYESIKDTTYLRHVLLEGQCRDTSLESLLL